MSGINLNNIVSDVYSRVTKGLTAFVYNGSEAFDDMKNTQQVPPLINKIIMALYAIGFVAIIVILVVAFGAAYLSMCYNSYLGVTDRSTVLISAAIAFIFFPAY